MLFGMGFRVHAGKQWEIQQENLNVERVYMRSVRWYVETGACLDKYSCKESWVSGNPAAGRGWE